MKHTRVVLEIQKADRFDDIAGLSGTFTLRFVGTEGVTYCLQTTTNLASPVVWSW